MQSDSEKMNVKSLLEHQDINQTKTLELEIIIIINGFQNIKILNFQVYNLCSLWILLRHMNASSVYTLNQNIELTNNYYSKLCIIDT